MTDHEILPPKKTKPKQNKKTKLLTCTNPYLDHPSPFTHTSQGLNAEILLQAK